MSIETEIKFKMQEWDSEIQELLAKKQAAEDFLSKMGYTNGHANGNGHAAEAPVVSQKDKKGLAWRAKQFLSEAGRPCQIREIRCALGLPRNKQNSLSNALWKSRDIQRVGRGVYGL